MAHEPDDSPELTEADFARLRPASEVLPAEVIAAFKRGRGPQKAPTKRLITLRLDDALIAHFKSSGPGWQTRINDTLAEAVAKKR
jgi:uncharacterized protein (DUF4415 family)